MKDDDYLLEEAREMWQKHLALVEGAEGDYMSTDDDATGYSGEITAEAFAANEKLIEDRLLDLKMARAVAVTREAYDKGYTFEDVMIHRDVGVCPTPDAYRRAHMAAQGGKSGMVLAELEHAAHQLGHIGFAPDYKSEKPKLIPGYKVFDQNVEVTTLGPSAVERMALARGKLSELTRLIDRHEVTDRMFDLCYEIDQLLGGRE